MLLGNNKIVQEYFIGDISKYKEKELIEAIENTIENIFEVKYENQVQNDTRNFADEIKSYLENSGEKL